MILQQMTQKQMKAEDRRRLLSFNVSERVHDHNQRILHAKEEAANSDDEFRTKLFHKSIVRASTGPKRLNEILLEKCEEM